MCRFVLYVSHNKPILLSELLTNPPHSIVKQSFACTERTESYFTPATLNADGFGVSWYPVWHNNVETPCLFTSVLPAWNNKNLWRLSEKIRSPLIFAHVRAASLGSVVSEANCHPFVSGRFVFMHNGGIGNFAAVKKHIYSILRPELISQLSGSTDSEHAFMLFLNNLPPEILKSEECVDPEILLNALQDTISQLIHIQKKFKQRTISILNFAISDGKTTLVSRVVVNTSKKKKDHPGASMYFSAGSGFVRCSDSEYRMRHTNMDEDVVIVASEKLTPVEEDWVEVPGQHIMVISHKTNVLLFPMDVEQELKDAKREMKSAKKSKSKSVKTDDSVSESMSPTASSFSGLTLSSAATVGTVESTVV